MAAIKMIIYIKLLRFQLGFIPYLKQLDFFNTIYILYHKKKLKIGKFILFVFDCSGISFDLTPLAKCRQNHFLVGIDNGRRAIYSVSEQVVL